MSDSSTIQSSGQPSKDDELVLGIDAVRLETVWNFRADGKEKTFLPWFLGMEELICDEGYFLPRGDCETDPTFKQIIPYVIVYFQATGQILTYRRGPEVGETRLAGNRSLGFGGHINPDDPFDQSYSNLYTLDRDWETIT